MRLLFQRVALVSQCWKCCMSFAVWLMQRTCKLQRAFVNKMRIAAFNTCILRFKWGVHKHWHFCIQFQPRNVLLIQTNWVHSFFFFFFARIFITYVLCYLLLILPCFVKKKKKAIRASFDQNLPWFCKAHNMCSFPSIRS